MNNEQLVAMVVEIRSLKEQGFTYKDIDAMKGWVYRSYILMRTPMARRIRRMLGI